MPKKRLAEDRVDELLVRLMDLIAVEGFASLKVSDMASYLKCSTSTLYRIAPSKESLVICAVVRWADTTLTHLRLEAEKALNSVEAARCYYGGIMRFASTLSPRFRLDVLHHESVRRLYDTMSGRSTDEFAVFLERAMGDGGVRRCTPLFAGMLCRNAGLVIGDPAALERAGLTREQATTELEALVWEGLLPR